MSNSSKEAGPATVSLWLWDINDPGNDDPSGESTNRLALALSPSERQRYSAMRSPSRRRAYLAGHHLLRRALDLTLPGWGESGTIAHPQDQHPRFEGELSQRLWFNLSHSGALCGCLISTLGPVGLDIEIPARARPYLALAEEYYAPEEAGRLSTLSGKALRDEFYRLWTLKESLTKARLGSVHDGGMAVAMVPETNATDSEWHSYRFPLAEGFGAFTSSVAVKDYLSCNRWDWETERWVLERLPVKRFGSL